MTIAVNKWAMEIGLKYNTVQTIKAALWLWMGITFFCSMITNSLLLLLFT